MLLVNIRQPLVDELEIAGRAVDGVALRLRPRIRRRKVELRVLAADQLEASISQGEKRVDLPGKLLDRQARAGGREIAIRAAVLADGGEIERREEEDVTVMRAPIPGGEVLDQILIPPVRRAVEDFDQLFGRQSFGEDGPFQESPHLPGRNGGRVPDALGAANEVRQLVTEHKPSSRAPADRSEPSGSPGRGLA
jgi:hypothetical protein